MPNKEQLMAMVATLARVFIASALAQYLTYGVSVFEVTGEQAKGIVSSGLAAGIVLVVQWVNPRNDKYGRGYISADVTPADQGDGPAQESAATDPVGEDGYVPPDATTGDNRAPTAGADNG